MCGGQEVLFFLMVLSYTGYLKRKLKICEKTVIFAPDRLNMLRRSAIFKSNIKPMKSARGTSPMTARQPAIIRVVRCQSLIDGCELFSS